MIPFPKLHIATSVMNRVMNAMNGHDPVNVPQPSPTPPVDPSALGQAVEEGAEAPPAPVEVPPQDQAAANDGMLDASLTGHSPLDGALTGVLGG